MDDITDAGIHELVNKSNMHGFIHTDNLRAFLTAYRQRPEVQAMERDAARYRWLREQNNNRDTIGARIAIHEYGMDWDAAIDAAARIAELEALSVTKILLNIVPGDGDGLEVYAKSTDDITSVFNEMSEKMARMEDAFADMKADRDRLREVLELALQSHGVMLLSDPPQDPWKVNRVEERARAALAQSKEKEHG